MSHTKFIILWKLFGFKKPNRKCGYWHQTEEPYTKLGPFSYRASCLETTHASSNKYEVKKVKAEDFERSMRA